MDVELYCKAKKCIFNLNGQCTAREIQVEGGDTMGGRFTYCVTFSVDNTEDMSLKNYTLNDNYNFFVNNPEVKCSARNCIYNERELCQAPYVLILREISSVPIQTECGTFAPR